MRTSHSVGSAVKGSGRLRPHKPARALRYPGRRGSLKLLLPEESRARRWVVVAVGVVIVLVVAGGTFAWVSRPGHSNSPSDWLTGTVEPPSGGRSGFTVIAANHTYSVSSDGTFSVPERPNSVTALIAEGLRAQHALLAVVASGQAQTASLVHLNATSTAQALVFLSPYVSTGDPPAARSILRYLQRSTAVQQLADLLRRMGGEPGSTSPDRAAFVLALSRTVASVVEGLHTTFGHPASKKTATATSLSQSDSLRPSGGASALLTAASSPDCTSAAVVQAGNFDDTEATVTLGVNSSCVVSIGDTGPAAQPVAGFIYPTLPAFVDAVTPLTPSDFSSQTALQATVTDSANLCTVYPEASSSPTGLSALLPPTSTADWLTDPVATAVKWATGQVFPSAGAAGVTVPGTVSALYSSRAFSGGGSGRGPAPSTRCGPTTPAW